MQYKERKNLNEVIFIQTKKTKLNYHSRPTNFKKIGEKLSSLLWTSKNVCKILTKISNLNKILEIFKAPYYRSAFKYLSWAVVTFSFFSFQKRRVGCPSLSLSLTLDISFEMSFSVRSNLGVALALLVFLPSLLARKDPLEPTKKDLFFSESNFAGVDLSLVNLRFAFDEELFISEDNFCSSQTFLPKEPTCIPCNYSGPTLDGSCVGSLNALDLPQLTEYQKQTLPNCTCNPFYCLGETLTVGKVFFVFSPSSLLFDIYLDFQGVPWLVPLSSSASKVFRFEYTNWTTGISVRVNPIDEGPFDVLLGLTPQFEQSQVLLLLTSTAFVF
jgi:hypothetical protein